MMSDSDLSIPNDSSNDYKSPEVQYSRSRMIILQISLEAGLWDNDSNGDVSKLRFRIVAGLRCSESMNDK